MKHFSILLVLTIAIIFSNSAVAKAKKEYSQRVIMSEVVRDLFQNNQSVTIRAIDDGRAKGILEFSQNGKVLGAYSNLIWGDSYWKTHSLLSYGLAYETYSKVQGQEENAFSMAQNLTLLPEGVEPISSDMTTYRRKTHIVAKEGKFYVDQFDFNLSPYEFSQRAIESKLIDITKGIGKELNFQGLLGS